MSIWGNYSPIITVAAKICYFHSWPWQKTGSICLLSDIGELSLEDRFIMIEPLPQHLRKEFNKMYAWMTGAKSQELNMAAVVWQRQKKKWGAELNFWEKKVKILI